MCQCRVPLKGLSSLLPLVLVSDPRDSASSQFALWVAFFEIYNECVYDLLQPSLCSKSKKRAALRVCDDGAGNAYVKGVRNMAAVALCVARGLQRCV